MELKGSLEDNVLTLVCTNDQHAPGLLITLTPQLFSTRHYRKIAELAFVHIEKFGKAPGAHLRDALEADLRRGEEGLLIKRILDDIDALAPSLQPDYVLGHLSRFIALRKIAMAVEAAADAVAAGDVEAAEAALYARNSTPIGSPGIWLTDPEQMLRFLNRREEDLFTSGIEALDVRGVRPARKEVFLFLGSKSVGKSWALIQCGKQNILNRRSVLHITLEMSDDHTAQRYVQSLFAMTQDGEATVRIPMFKKDQLGRFTSLDYDVLEPEHLRPAIRAQVSKKLLAFKSKPPLKIKEFPTSSLTIPMFNAYLDMLERLEGFKPDMVVVDYAKLFALDIKQLRLSIGHMMEQLRGIAVTRNIAIVTAWQGNRETDSARTVTSGMISEDWSLAGTVDTLVTISKTPAESKQGLCRLLVDKARSAKDKYVVLLTQSYATGQFCIDSVFMNHFVQEEVKRSIGEGDDSESSS
jgi:hypothetical protein